MKTLYCFMLLKSCVNMASIGEARENFLFLGHNYSIVTQDIRMTSPKEEVADDGYVTIFVYSYGLAGWLGRSLLRDSCYRLLPVAYLHKVPKKN